MNIKLSRTKYILFLASLLLLNPQVFAQKGAFSYTIQKQAKGKKGAVVSAHPLASIVGLQMLEKGGNAVDAAIATQLALAVVYPGAGNLGGGGFMVARLQSGKLIALDYREKAPAKAYRDMYLDKEGNPITKLSLDGAMASGVPGTPAGLFESMKYAKLPFAILIQPAIDLAEKGHVVTAAQARGFNYMKSQFSSINQQPIVFVKKSDWKEGDTLRQPQLAETLKRMRDGGSDGFYKGETARLIVEEMKRSGGIISLEDLAAYNAKERVPLEFEYRGHQIISMPLPSSGGIIIAQTLQMMEPYDLKALGFQSPQAVQLMVEAERRSFADRAEYLGDPDFVEVPVAKLMNGSYNKNRMKDFIAGKAGSSKNTKAGNLNESMETTHLSVADAEGNIVAVTTTLNGNYGSKLVVGGAGFLLNNEMDDFSVKPGTPNMFGAIGNDKNAIAPGKRMLSSMTPTLVLKKNKPFLVIGTPGGTTIPTSVFQTIVNVIDFNMTTEEAVNKPKFHHQWLPDVVTVEPDFDANTKSTLQQMGYEIKETSQLGRTEVIRLDYQRRWFLGRKKPTLIAVGDKRGDDDARAY